MILVLCSSLIWVVPMHAHVFKGGHHGALGFARKCLEWTYASIAQAPLHAEIRTNISHLGQASMEAWRDKQMEALGCIEACFRAFGAANVRSNEYRSVHLEAW
eukprot:1160808-Pelagomonas_calceolata.AAC.24